MLEVAGMERVFGLSQLFFKRNSRGEISLIIAKVTDDFLLETTCEETQAFTELMQKRFKVGKVIINEKLHFNGCEIEQDEPGSITMSMIRYLDRLTPFDISRSRQKMRAYYATDKEVKLYRSLVATLMFLGNAVLPQASYATSLLQQKMPKLTFEELVLANNILKEVLSMKPQIVFKAPPHTTQITEVIVSSFSDALFNHNDLSGYGQTGFLTGLQIKQKNGIDLYDAVDWACGKQK